MRERLTIEFGKVAEREYIAAGNDGTCVWGKVNPRDMWHSLRMMRNTCGPFALPLGG